MRHGLQSANFGRNIAHQNYTAMHLNAKISEVKVIRLRDVAYNFVCLNSRKRH